MFSQEVGFIGPRLPRMMTNGEVKALFKWFEDIYGWISIKNYSPWLPCQIISIGFHAKFIDKNDGKIVYKKYIPPFRGKIKKKV